jgi:adenylate kinase
MTKSSCSTSKKKQKILNKFFCREHLYDAFYQNIGLTETGKVLYRCLKYRLSRNDCYNRGYVLDDPLLGHKDLEILFKPMSKKALRRIRPKPKKEKKVKPAPPTDEPKKRDNADPGAGEEEAGEEEQGGKDENGAVEEQKAEEEQKEGEEEEQKEDADDDAADADNDNDEEKPKLENFAAESVIFFEKERENFHFYDDKNDLRKEEIQNYFDNLKVETLTIDITNHKNYEGMEDLRLYIERVGPDDRESPAT